MTNQTNSIHGVDTIIEANGSTWAPRPTDELFAALENHPLDVRSLSEFVLPVDGAIFFFGKFSGTSHAFLLRSAEPEFVARLTRAIATNLLLQADPCVDCTEPTQAKAMRRGRIVNICPVCQELCRGCGEPLDTDGDLCEGCLYESAADEMADCAVRGSRED